MTFKSNKITLIFNEQGWVYVYQDGSLISVESPTGQTLNFIYQKGDLQRVEQTDPDGMTTPLILIACTYDEQHRCVQMEIGPLLHRFAYEEKLHGRLIGWDQPGDGQSLNFYYDERSGVLNEVEKARAEKWPVKPGESVKLIPYGEPLTLKCKFFEPRQKQVEGGDPKRNPANYFIEDDGTYRYSYSTNPNGWQQGNNPPPYTVTAEDDNGLKQSLKVGVKDNLFAITNAYGKETKALYYGNGLPYSGRIRALYQDGERVMQYRYDKKTGWLTQTTDRDGVSTFYEYRRDGYYTPLFQGKYGKGIKTTAFDPKPVRISRGYEPRVAEVIAEMDYDNRGRLIAQTDGEGNVTEFSYNEFGELASVKPPDAGALTLQYDEYGRVAEVTQGGADDEAKPQTLKLAYDPFGKINKQTAPDGSETAFTYNELGQVQEVRKNNQLLAAYEYDLDGKVVGEKDGKNRAKKLERDLKGNIVAEILPGGIVTKYEYDAQGHRTAQIDANGNKITFKYDAYGHLVEQKNPLGQTLTWTYNKDGKLTQRTNGAQTVRYEYDERGRPWLIDYGAAGQQVRYTYNARGQVTREETPTFLVEKKYDYQNRVTVLQMIDLRQALGNKEQRLKGQVIRYKYNSRGQKTQTVLAETVTSDKTATKPKYDILQQTDYQYDSQGKLTGIRGNGQPVFTQKYDTQNRLATRLYHNGIRADYRHDDQGRLTKITYSGVPRQQALALEYTWDEGNELVSRGWNGETQWFGYDAAGRLTGVFSDQKKTKPLEKYAYDPAGNITEKMVYGERAALKYNAANQLISMEGGGRTVNYTYDPAGRLTVSADNLTGQTVNQYGWLDKPVTIERQGLGNISASGAVALDYYPDGHLAVKGPVDSSLLAEALKPSVAVKGKDESGAFAQLLKLVGLRTEDEALCANACQTRMQVADVYVWDGLGLLRRNHEVYVIEPHISGGVAVYVARIGDFRSGRYLINDMLGTTLMEVDGGKIRFNTLSAFGLPVKRTQEIPKPDTAVPKVPTRGRAR
ncbi:MAG: hypothetical protein LBK76_12045 [Verrucomicrobiales bacterium]|nr:hypothetical protein [Verrucomicrobiales bacterium]